MKIEQNQGGKVMEYKKAKYIYMITNDKSDALVYNVRTTKALRVAKSFMPELQKLLSQDTLNDTDIAHSPWINELIREEFIIPKSFDEVKWCKMKKNQMIYSSDDLEVLLIPTNACNFRCTYCFQNHVENYMSEEVEQRIVKFFEKKIPKSKMLRLGLFGGEPLLCADQLLRLSSAADRICKENGVPLAGEISTNGYLLTPDLFQKFLKVRIYDFQVCVDGPMEQHNTTRPHMNSQDSFSVIMNNLKEIKNKIKGRFSFTIRINLTPSVEPHLDLFLQELAKDFSGNMQFHIVIQCVRNWGGNTITPDQIVEDESIRYKKWYSRIRELGMRGADALYFTPFAYCTAYQKNAYIIDYDASILKCTHTQQDDNRIGCLDKWGNISQLDEWKESKWLVSDNTRNESEKCERCVLYPFCMEG